MAGELLVQIQGHNTLGSLLTYNRDLSAYDAMMAVMIVILIVGILADTLFTVANNSLRRRWGLDIDSAA
jgi:NitT/TauT family transport system permease protein